MRLLQANRLFLEHDMDDHGRFFQERVGKDELDFNKVNPHRVQLFSINEIWKCIKGKLIELNVIRDSEVLGITSNGDESDEIPDHFDFVRFKNLRLKNLFGERHDQEKHLSCVRKLLKKNDLKFISKLAEQVHLNLNELKRLDRRIDLFEDKLKTAEEKDAAREDRSSKYEALFREQA